MKFTCHFQNSICKCRFAMINMSYNAEVSSVFNWDLQNFVVNFLAKMSA